MVEMTVKAYGDFLDEGRIMGSRCKNCGAVHLPPRPVCPECRAQDPEWAELGGEGAVQAYTVVAVPLTRLKDRCPYTVGVVKLDGGPSVSGMILGVSEGSEISVGTRVRAEFVKEGDRTVLCFRLT